MIGKLTSTRDLTAAKDPFDQATARQSLNGRFRDDANFKRPINEPAQTGHIPFAQFNTHNGWTPIHNTTAPELQITSGSTP
jgi:hypothetical protein